VSISPANGPVNSGNSQTLGQSAPQRTSLLSPHDTSSLATIPEEIKQVCKPSSVVLNPESVPPLEGYVTLNAMTKASLDAISQTLKMNDDLAKLLGGQS
jgi:hypothetical protein